MVKTRLLFHDKAPWTPEWARDCLLIHDRVLLRHPTTAAWVRRFSRRYAVTGGEACKDVRAFPRHIEKVSRLAGDLANRRLTIVVAGGGSIGDLGGFIAAVFKRGVRLVHVPTTWLAAIDSAHGGKNGLNVLGVKNQIGTIDPANEVRIVREFLFTQPPARAIEGAGEVLKMALLSGGAVARLGWTAEDDSANGLWRSLPTVIRGKTEIVARDPLEKKGIRHLLNLGHTMGHVFEAALGLPHGLAVSYGLAFALAFSRSEGVCSAAAYERMIAHPLWSLFLPSSVYLRCLSLSLTRVRKLLLQDKKRTKGKSLRFIFLKDIGRPVIREIEVERILRELQRQKALLRGLYG